MPRRARDLTPHYLAAARELTTHDRRVTQIDNPDDPSQTRRFTRFLAERDAIITEYRERIEALRAEQAAKIIDLAAEYELEVAPERVEGRRQAVLRLDAALPRIIADPKKKP